MLCCVHLRFLLVAHFSIVIASLFIFIEGYTVFVGGLNTAVSYFQIKDHFAACGNFTVIIDTILTVTH